MVAEEPRATSKELCKLLLNTKARLSFANEHHDDLQDLWDDAL